jgi:hypothetical protein
MKDPRTWNRREFAVTPNGLFSILRPTGWFSAVRLPGGFRYRVGLSEETEFSQVQENPTENPAAAPLPESTFVPEQNALEHAGSQKTAILSQSMIPSTHDYRLMRTALIVLAAAAITLIILLWLVDYVPEIVKQP